MNVAMIELLAQTPFYDRYLSEAVAPLVDRFTLYTIRFHHEPDYFNDATFDYSPGLVDLVSGWRIKIRPLRQVAKMVEYGLNWLFLLRRFRLQPPDVVHIQRLPLLSRVRWELDAVKRLRHSGVPVVYTVHNYLPHEDSLHSHQVYQRLYASVDHLIVHTQTDRKRLVKDFDISEDKASVIPHGPLFSEQAGFDGASARAALGLREPDFVLLMLGVIRPYKGIEETIRALAQVVEQHIECQLVVVGQALNGNYLRRLQALASELDVQSHIQWHTRYVPSAQIGLFHAAADVVLFPYRDISQSGAFLTAAGLGKCTLTTQVAGLAEIVRDEERGVQIAAADPAMIADGLRQCIELAPEHRDRMGIALQKYVQTHCNWDLVARKTVDVYRRVKRDRATE